VQGRVGGCVTNPFTLEAAVSGPGDLVVEERFAIVPEWIIDAEVSDGAFRLYSVLLRYGQSSGARMPSRSTLARRLRRSVDSVDRAMKELVAVGAVVVEHRQRGGEQLTNRYHVMSSRRGSRTGAATHGVSTGGRTPAARGSRTPTAGVAAAVRPDPEVSTQSSTPPPSPADLEAVAEECRAARRRLGLPSARWTSRVLAVVIQRAVDDHGWPADAAIPALIALAADPQTRSPARLEQPGPWWNAAETTLRARQRHEHADELRELEAWLAETGGARVTAQRRAREHLAATGRPMTALAVARLASQYLGRAGNQEQIA
jgi:hypothetical protein